MKEQKFFICKHCKNLVGMIDNAGVPLICCGEKMTELVANQDGAESKHKPIFQDKDGVVNVSIATDAHPMQPEHHIGWIYIQTTKGGQRKNIQNEQVAEAQFKLSDDDKLVNVFSYCNLHGLWKA